MDIQQLAQLNGADYEEIVNKNIHIKTADADVWAALTSPELISRTRETMSGIFQRVSTTIRIRKGKREEFHQECFRRGPAGKTEWFESVSEYEMWRIRAGHFQAAVQARLSELGKLQKDLNRASNHLNQDRNREALRQLAVLVQRHQAAHAQAGGIAEQCDYELWQSLDRIMVSVYDREVTLRSMLEVFWFDVAPSTAAEERGVLAEKLMQSAPAGQGSRFSGVPKARHVGNEKRLA